MRHSIPVLLAVGISIASADGSRAASESTGLGMSSWTFGLGGLIGGGSGELGFQSIFSRGR